MKPLKPLYFLLFTTLFFANAQTNSSLNTNEMNNLVVPNSKFTIDVYYGFGYRTAKIDASLSGDIYNLVKDLKSGDNITLEAGYMFHDGLSVGLTYDRFSASASNISYKGSNSISYLGINGNYRLFLFQNRAELRFGTGLGWMGFESDVADKLTNDLTSTGNTLGVDISSSLQYMISKSIALGARFGFASGVLSKFKVTNNKNGTTTTVTLEGDDKESLANLSVSAGIRIYL